MWSLTTIYKLTSKGFNTLFWHCMHSYTGKTLIYVFKNKEWWGKNGTLMSLQLDGSGDPNVITAR